MLPRHYDYEIPKIFAEFFDDFSNTQTPYDIRENDKEYVVEAALAGVKKENISLNVEEDILTIKAERKDNKESKFNRKETFYGNFEKSFSLPENVNVEKIDASFVDGILYINIPKKINPKKSKVIEIQ